MDLKQFVYAMQVCGTFSSLVFICLFLQVTFSKPASTNEGVVMEICISSLVCLAVCRGGELKICKPLRLRGMAGSLHTKNETSVEHHQF